MRSLWLTALMIPQAILLSACGAAEEAEAPPVEDKCPEISMDGLAADWIKVVGNSGDHKTRIRVLNEGGSWQGWYVGGFFKKTGMTGKLRANDLQLTEVLDAKANAAFEAGERTKTRIYIEPYKQRCAMRVMEVAVKMSEGKESEAQKGGYIEYLPFPPGQEFTYQAPTEQLFIAEAADDYAKAQAQLEKGGPDPVGTLGEKVPIGMWSDAKADGDPGCTYDMDLYFDDRPLEGGQAVAAGEAKDDRRHWRHDFYAPYSGNHNFEMYRYRTCEGGSRELIAVAGIEGILN